MRSRAASRGLKRKAEVVAKKLRSKIPRRRRTQFSPILRSSLPCKDEEVSGISVVSSSHSLCHGDDDVSCGSVGAVQRRFVLNERKKTFSDLNFRRITRSFYKQKQIDSERNDEMEVSDSSCIQSNSEIGIALSSLKINNGGDVKGHERSENDVVSVSQSDAISVEQDHVSDARNLKLVSPENKDNDDVSVTYGEEFPSDSKFGTVTEGHDGEALIESEFSEISKPNSVAESNFTLFNYGSVAEQQPGAKGDGSGLDLTCTEELQFDDDSEFSENATSDWLSDTFTRNSDVNSLGYTSSSTFFDSGSQFSEKSSVSSSTSETSSLLLQFKEQFSRSTVPNSMKSNSIQEYSEILPTVVKFEDDEEEESYQKFRERESRQVYLRDYAEDYSSRTSYGNLVLRQRLQIVPWIIEECTAKGFQQETVFLAVGLFDQFLMRGFFKSERNLQIAGIACLSLANRMEENQPYNSVRQRNFYFQNNRYRRCEVVAMEWLVQEVLNFNCFLPTIYNFLWFYLRAVNADTKVERKAKYLAILALSDHRLLQYLPSTVAAALVILASVDNGTANRRVSQVHVRTKHDDLQECIKVLKSKPT